MTGARRYLYWLAGYLGVELLSWTAWRSSVGVSGEFSPMTIAFAALVLVSLWLAVKRPNWLALLTLAELVVGGKGYLFWLDLGSEKISIRLALFLLLMLAAVIETVRTRRFEFPKQLRRPIGLILTWVVVMSLVGLMRGYGRSGVFDDMNGYLYLVLIWPWWLFLRRLTNWKSQVIIVLLAGATMVGVKSWLIQLLFAQNIGAITSIYKWIRQTGIGEITLISKNVYRIFFQSQIYALLAFIFIFVGFVRHRHQSWWGIAILGSSLGVYVSLSRSLWLGLAVAVGSFLLISIWKKDWRGLRRSSICIPLALFVWLMTTWALNFPYIITPSGRPSTADAVVARLKSAGSSQASTARANQFPPLVKAITRAPVTGHGFGATLTYYSTDPRIRGARTTSAFELGYLDMAFHFGLLGLILIGWWIWRVGKKLWTQPDAAMWIWPSVALAAVHLTSPYLNHPLGLGWLALVSLIAFDHD